MVDTNIVDCSLDDSEVNKLAKAKSVPAAGAPRQQHHALTRSA
jgi:hypothetical protein